MVCRQAEPDLRDEPADWACVGRIAQPLSFTDVAFSVGE